MAVLSKNDKIVRIAKNVAMLMDNVQDTFVLNLGVGMPTQVSNYVANDNIFVHAENGMIGVGPLAEGDQIHPMLINASRQPVLETPGCCYTDSGDAFGMIRGGHIDCTVLGAFEVDQQGDISNWIIPNGKQLGVGGAMDLVTGAKKVIIVMTHTDKNGGAKLVKKCALPVTGVGEADLVVTEMGMFFFENRKVILKKIAPDVTLEDIAALTELEYEVSPKLQKMLP